MDNLHSDHKNKVHEVLLALQKSLSRVSRDSADKKRGDAYALITGDVNFSFTLKCDLEEDHNLVLQKEGAIELHLDGSIVTDIDVQDVLAEPKLQDAESTTQTPVEKDNNHQTTPGETEEFSYPDLHKLSPEKLTATLDQIEIEMEKKTGGLKSVAIETLLKVLISLLKINVAKQTVATAEVERQASKPVKRKTSRK